VQVVFRRSFAKDLKKVRRKALRQEVQAIIEQVEQIVNLYDLPNVKRLTSDGPYYRIRIGEYRMGMIVEGGTVTFVRFLHRRDIYRYFP
jgi:mRNA interferase RelE/StbE